MFQPIVCDACDGNGVVDERTVGLIHQTKSTLMDMVAERDDEALKRAESLRAELCKVLKVDTRQDYCLTSEAEEIMKRVEAAERVADAADGLISRVFGFRGGSVVDLLIKAGDEFDSLRERERIEFAKGLADTLGMDAGSADAIWTRVEAMAAALREAEAKLKKRKKEREAGVKQIANLVEHLEAIEDDDDNDLLVMDLKKLWDTFAPGRRALGDDEMEGRTACSHGYLRGCVYGCNESGSALLNAVREHGEAAVVDQMIDAVMEDEEREG